MKEFGQDFHYQETESEYYHYEILRHMIRVEERQNRMEQFLRKSILMLTVMMVTGFATLTVLLLI